MIPAHVDIGGSSLVLPKGIHVASLVQVRARFATNGRRRQLFDGVRRGFESLLSAGCDAFYLDGSFVTDKDLPGDFDVCWDPLGVDIGKVDPVMLDFTCARAAQKLKYGGEFFPSSALADGSNAFLEFFQVDRETGKEKGIIKIEPHTAGGAP